MATMDWTSFSRKIKIEASIDKAFSAWTGIDIVTQWFLKELKLTNNIHDSGTICTGSKTIWVWNNYPVEFEVEYLEVIKNEKISFSFGHDMIVDLSFSEENGYTLIHLFQYNISEEDQAKMNFYAGCRGGWTFWLTNLKCYLEHNITLHDKTLHGRKDLMDFVNS